MFSFCSDKLNNELTITSLVKYCMAASKQVFFSNPCRVAEVTDYDDWVTAITNLVKKLPQINHKVLCFFINHLSK